MKVGFIFSLKVPRTITHEKVVVECDKESKEFIGVAHMLGEKLGPMVFQLPFFNDSVFSSHVQFVALLQAFFKKLPRIGGCRFAVEIRNTYWLKPRLLDLLWQNNVALVLQDQSRMPHPRDLENYDLITLELLMHPLAWQS